MGNSFLTLVAREKLNDSRTNAIEICAELYENLCCNAFTFPDESKENMFGADVIVAKLKSFTK